MLIKKRVENGSLQEGFSETIHEQETKEFQTFLESKGYDPGEIIKEVTEEPGQN